MNCTRDSSITNIAIPPQGDKDGVQTDFEFYQGSNDEYLALVSYTLNGNQVAPQVIRLTVELENNHYLLSSVDLLLMNQEVTLSTNRNRIRDEPKLDYLMNYPKIND